MNREKKRTNQIRRIDKNLVKNFGVLNSLAKLYKMEEL